MDSSKAVFSSLHRNERVGPGLKSSIDFSVAGGGFAFSTVTIDHNLGYCPYFRAWYTFGGKKFGLFAGTSSFNLDGNSAQIDSVNATTTALVIVIDNFGVPAISGTIYYRIYEEPQA